MTAPSTEETLRRLERMLREDGGLLAQALDGAVPAARRDGDPGFGALSAGGPRADGRRDDIALIVEAIREGFLLHYGASRLFPGIEADLALLAGDRLYALGLARLAVLGDLDAVAELADLISLCAQAHVEERPDLAQAAWEAGAAAVGWGAGAALRDAKAGARAGDPEAVQRLRAAARELVAGGTAAG